MPRLSAVGISGLQAGKDVNVTYPARGRIFFVPTSPDPLVAALGFDPWHRFA